MRRAALVVLVFSAVLLQKPRAFAQTQSKPLTIEAIYAPGGLTGREPETVQWSPDGKTVSYILRENSGEQGQLWGVDVASGKSTVLVSENRLAALCPPDSKIVNEREKERRRRYAVACYHWAPDSKSILFDSLGTLWFYNLATHTAVPYSPGAEPSGDPKFSPDGKLVAYVQKHNLFVGDTRGRKYEQLTREKDENLSDGEVDWVYSEELGARSNYFWSPSGKQIVFLQMNETQVPLYPIEDFIPTHPTVDYQRYPKAGDPNPGVRLGVVRSAGGKVHWITLPEQKGCHDDLTTTAGSACDIYLPRFGWVREDVLYAEVLNRAQDTMKLYFIDANSGDTRLMLTESSDAWVEVNDDFRLTEGKFIWSSWRDGHTHLYLYSFDGANPLGSEARLERQLTHGPWEVLGVQSVHGDRVYFAANKEDDRQQQLYSIKLDGSGLQQVSKEAGWHEVTMTDDSPIAPGPQYYLDDYSALMTPPSYSVCVVGGKCSPFWQSRNLAGYDLIAPRFVDFKAEDGTVLHGELVLPRQSPTAAPHSIPLVLNPYGGPGAQMVRDYAGLGEADEGGGSHHLLFDQLLARDGIAVLHVDNRGMAARGKQFTAVIKRKFGEVELRDQLAALDQTLAQFPQLDPGRLGFWGWSYGGFMTLNALTRTERFRTGVAVSPVTDWHDYDSIYTERYMGLPQEYPAGYESSSPVHSAASLHGDLLEIHGTGDDNVHMQNTIQMTQAFLDAGKHFELMLYPRKTHSLWGAEVRSDLFHRIEEHFKKTLLGPQ